MAWVAILQVLLGFLLFLQGLRPKDGLHLLYGLLLAAGLHYLGASEPGGGSTGASRTRPSAPSFSWPWGFSSAWGSSSGCTSRAGEGFPGYLIPGYESGQCSGVLL